MIACRTPSLGERRSGWTHACDGYATQGARGHGPPSIGQPSPAAPRAATREASLGAVVGAARHPPRDGPGRARRRDRRGRYRLRGDELVRDAVAGPARSQGPGDPVVRAADPRLRPQRQGRAGPVRAGEPPRRRLPDIPSSSWTRRRRPRTGRSGRTTAIDPRAIVAAAIENASGERANAARPRSPSSSSGRACCPTEVVAPGADRYLRKAKEIIQAARLTEAFPGEAGKQQIITAYLNEIFYGHEAYGIAAAAQIYFGIADLADLTPAQAALLAGLPKSPSIYDPYRYATRTQEGRLVVPDDVAAGRPPRLHPPQPRRTRAGRTSTAAAARGGAGRARRPRRRRALVMRAPHFAWQVRSQLEDCSAAATPSRRAATG